MADLERRIADLEAEWAVVKHYARRVAMLASLALASYVAHMDTMQIAAGLQWVATRLAATGG